jgi:hypothetical protein
MPNPVAANDYNPISGSLQTSRISYAVETAGKNYGQDYNGTTWYSDIPQNGSQYTIISDNYTANYYVSRSNAEGAYVEGGLPAVDEYSAPVFWMTAGTSSLDIITIVNGLPDRIGQIPFNSGSQALNWIASSSNYFAVGPPYEQIDADSLKLYLNAGQIISYPTTASTWYDLSGYSSKGTLVNNPAFNSNGWFGFDGTDDYVNFFNNSLLNIGTSNFSQTVTFLINSIPGAGQRITFKRLGGLGYGYSMFIDGSGALGFEILTPSTFIIAYGGYPSTGRWHQATFSLDRSGNGILYLDGVAGTPVSFSSLVGLDISNNEDFCLAAVSPAIGGGSYLNGNLSTVASYAKQLSASEVLQNYYQGPVVTGSISGSYYANNLVSYVTGSTAAYNLSANIISGSLQNGVGFSPLNGGYWSFDGTDDLILLEGSTTNAWILNSGDTWTVNAWVRTPSGSFGSAVDGGYYYGPILSNTSGGPIYSTFQINGGTIAYTHYNGGWLTKYGTTVVNDGNWHMLTWINESNNITFYVDNIPNGTFNSTISGVGWLDTIGSAVGNYFIGDIASVQINKGKAFTASEVLQQYNATK